MSTREQRARERDGASLRQRIRASWSELSRSERAIAQYILDTHPQVAFETVHSLGAASGTSARSVMRLVQKLGYPGYPELQSELQREIEERLSSPVARFRTSVGNGDGVPWIERITQNLAELAEEAAAVEAGAPRIARAKGRVFVFGAGKSAGLAMYMWHELALVRPSTVLLSGADLEVIDQVFDVGPQDALIACDFRRYPPLVGRVASLARDAGAYVFVICDTPMAPAAVVADDLLAVRTTSTFLFDSYVAALAGIDLLVGLVAKALPESRLAARLDAFETAAKRGAVFREIDRRPSDV
jgi:DNA-binding MurR/RpiR family transcriptional regulator